MYPNHKALGQMIRTQGMADGRSPGLDEGGTPCLADQEVHFPISSK